MTVTKPHAGEMTEDTLAEALEREHGEIDAGIQAFLSGLADTACPPAPEPLRQAMDALRRHIFLEEEFLFPPLREAGLFAPIFVMLREHGEMWRAMEVLEAQLGPRAGTALSEGCHDLLAQLERHNTKEEAIVYPQADEVLTAPAAAGLRAFLEAGRVPAGWVCSGAAA
jgi:regulator of cell morphogenesis and NO signaling